MNISQFTLWDITVNVVPGVLLLLLVSILTPQRLVESLLVFYSEGGLLAALTVLVLSYTFGRVFQEGVSRELDNVIVQISWSDRHQSAKQHFSEEMNKAREDNNPTIRKMFLEDSIPHFLNEDINSIDNVDQRIDDSALFRLCQEYVIGNKIGRLNRFTILSRFHRSLYILGLLAMPLLFTVQFVWPVLGYTAVLNWGDTLIIMIIIGIVSVFSFRERWYFEQKMTDALINGYYTSRAE
ncbi:hypothetical protein [Halorubrum salipaludis]|uniref:hypothetical protein n=1 Tax=Halorubrum salipaludis TaxID=2032630 RepID=UPI00118185A7|nr:hypothetical protein [Halorubrum salipaludis]